MVLTQFVDVTEVASAQTVGPQAQETTTARPALPIVSPIVAATEQVQKSTITIRIDRLSPPSQEKTKSKNPRYDDPIGMRPAAAKEVIVFSGVCIGKKLAVTPLFLEPTEGIRVTVAGGKQVTARTIVMDEYSGLALLELDQEVDDSIVICPQTPPDGSDILCFSASGAQKPLVSKGLISGVDRRLPNVPLPPMLACDVRTSKSCIGAPIVSTKGDLCGVVLSKAAPQDGGWTYAVPASHVARMVHARAEFLKTDSAKSGKSDVLVIPRRVPFVGMTLMTVGKSVVVERVAKNGPAEKAGFAKEDRIIGVEGTQIRSSYQALLKCRVLQPGDVVKFSVVGPAGESVQRSVTLGGAHRLDSSWMSEISKYIRPQIVVRPEAPVEQKAKPLMVAAKELEEQLDPNLKSSFRKLMEGVQEQVKSLQTKNESHKAQIEELKKLNQRSTKILVEQNSTTPKPIKQNLKGK